MVNYTPHSLCWYHYYTLQETSKTLLSVVGLLGLALPKTEEREEQHLMRTLFHFMLLLQSAAFCMLQKYNYSFKSTQ